MADKIVVACECGKKYRLPAGKSGKKLKCKDCGNYFVATPADGVADESDRGTAGAMAPASALAQPPSVAAPPPETIFDIETLDVSKPVEPDALIEPLRRVSIWPLLGVSVGVHVVLIAITSIHYFMLVPKYGWINPEGKQAIALREAEDAKEQERRRLEREARLKEIEKKKAEEEKKQAEAKAKEGKNGGGKNGDGKNGDKKDPFSDQTLPKKDAVPTNPLELE